MVVRLKKCFYLLLCAVLMLGCAGIVHAEGTIGEAGSLFDGMSFTEKPFDGFLIPAPDGWSSVMSSRLPDYMVFVRNGTVSDGSKMSMEVSWYLPSSPYHYAEDPEVAEKEIRSDFDKIAKEVGNGEQEFIDLNGHPAGLMTYSMSGRKGEFGAYCGRVAYARNNRYLLIFVYIMGNDASKTTKITMNDLKTLAEKIGYDEAQAPFTAARATFTISGKNGAFDVTAGKALQMEAVFDQSDVINKKEKNDAVNWTVRNAETGKEEPLAAISEKGQLKVDKGLAAPVDLEVSAASAAYGTEAKCVIHAYPVVTGVTVSPAELFFYTGTDKPQTIEAALEPDTMPKAGITWSPAKEGIVEITPVEDGKVSVRPLAAGKTTIQVTEPTGKKAKLNVSVTAPVETVELTVKGVARPGGTVSVSAALAPKEAGNKNVEWSLDVGEDIASINEKGQVKIAGETASGTIITVTCKALGAPEPVVAAVKLEVQ